MEPYKTCIVLFDTARLKRFMRNGSVTLNKEKIGIDDEESPKDPELSSDKKK